MGRKILFVTTDQQRYDTLGCNGGTLSRTPVVDGLAAQGVRYERAVPQSVVCMPSRSTMLTGQHPSTHGVWMNGVALPADAPSVVAELQRHGYRTALVGKPHFEPFLDPFGRFPENLIAQKTGTVTPMGPWYDGTIGPHRGFEHMELATHSPMGQLHYARFVMQDQDEIRAAAAQFVHVKKRDLTAGQQRLLLGRVLVDTIGDLIGADAAIVQECVAFGGGAIGGNGLAAMPR